MTRRRESRSGPSWAILPGDCRASLATLEAGSVQTCITSPPYYALRDYGDSVQDWPAVEYSTLGGPLVIPAMRCALGLESTVEAFVGHLVLVFRAVWPVLAEDGTLWLNLGDSYAMRAQGGSQTTGSHDGALGRGARPSPRRRMSGDLKNKDLIGVPWMVAFALRADGWYLRMDNVWSKTNPMPESVGDRPTKAHEYVFLLAKAPQYYYDADAIAEPVATRTAQRLATARTTGPMVKVDESRKDAKPDMAVGNGENRNKRSVWSVATHSFPGAHFATFPPKLIEPCILAGCPEGGTVLDPFAGACTTGLVSLRRGRSFIGCELNPEYVELGRDRLIADSPLHNTAAEVAA